jgi:pimeloyl-ACP methyl ester carboxylesterase
MDASDAPASIGHDRRGFLGAAGAVALAAGAIRLGLAGPARAQPASASFGPVRQVKAGVLSTGYVELGPAHGRPVILMHGFPYDIHSYVEVAPLLAAEGYRVIVPYFRGYGSTTFLSASTPRNVDQAAFALDILALMDALGIERAILAGYDWGSRTGDIIAALWPQRVTGLVSVTVSIVIGNYRWRQGLYPAEPEYASIEARLQASPVIAVPAITIDGVHDPFTPAGNGAAYRDKFTGQYDHRTFDVGHNVPQEAPRAFARAVIDVDRL